MICISVTPESRTLAKVDLLNASRRCDLIELCLDHLVKEPDVGDMLAGVTKPVLVSCRRPEEGGHFQGTDEQRTALLRQAIVAGPAYVELDFETAARIPRFGSVKRVVSHASLDRPLGGVDEIFEQAAKLNADVVKFTWPTPALEHAWPLLAAVTRKRELPVVGMAFGAAAATFSLLAQRFGAPWIYAALEKGMEVYPGQPTVSDLEDVYDYTHIDPKTRFIGVVGLGAAEAQTARVINAGLQQLGVNRRCLPLVLDDGKKAAKMLESLKITSLFLGDEQAADGREFPARQEEAVERSGFADTLYHETDGWHAYNMFWRSVLSAVENTLGQKSADERPLDRRNVLILGAGALARSIIYGVHRRKGIISVTAPDDKQSQKLAEAFQVRFVPFANLYDTLADVVIIADPNVAMGHHKTELNPSYLRPNMLVVDVCRLPEETDFLREARQRGCRTVDPKGIFLNRLSAQFKAAAGQELPEAASRSVLGN